MSENGFWLGCLWAALLFAAFDARAFDSAAWLERRADLMNEVERLRAAYQQCVRDLQTPAEDVMLPVETFPNGAVKTSVHAKKAQYFLQAGLVWAEGVTIRTFKPDGSPDVVLVAQNCVVDRETKSAWAEGVAKLTQGQTVFRGRGVYFSSPESYVRVMQDAELLSNDLKGLEGVRK